MVEVMIVKRTVYFVLGNIGCSAGCLPYELPLIRFFSVPAISLPTFTAQHCLRKMCRTCCAGATSTRVQTSKLAVEARTRKQVKTRQHFSVASAVLMCISECVIGDSILIQSRNSWEERERGAAAPRVITAVVLFYVQPTALTTRRIRNSPSRIARHQIFTSRRCPLPRRGGLETAACVCCSVIHSNQCSLVGACGAGSKEGNYKWRS